MSAQPTWLSPLATFVASNLGIHFPPERWGDLERCVRTAAREAGSDDPDEFARALVCTTRDEARIEVLTQALTVGETYFLREPRSFELLEREVLPPLIAQRRTAGRVLRLWSAGCSTGEEAYSLAIVVDRLLPQRDDWRITILATDVNQRFLRTAARGEYGAWSFRGTPPWLKDRYFSPNGENRYAIDARIRRMVRFAPLNLVQATYPDWHSDTLAMDVILCRNVVMYFAPQQRQAVLERLEHALADGGWLLLSATETSVASLKTLTPVRFDGAVFHRKAAAAPPAVRPPMPMPMPMPMPLSLHRPVAESGQLPDDTHSMPPDIPSAPAPAAPDLLRAARAHADAGRLDLACRAVEQAVAADKLNAAAHYLHALILLEMGRDALAREALQRAVYLEPDLVLAHHALGLLALRQGKAGQAQRHFDHALALLARLGADAVLVHSDGLCAGHLRASIEATLSRRQSA